MSNIIFYLRFFRVVCFMHFLLVCRYHVNSLLIFNGGPKYNVMEGDDVEMICHHNASQVTIFLDSDVDKVIVNQGKLAGDPAKYKYQNWTNASTNVNHSLLVRNISRNEGGSYSCLQYEPLNSMSLELNVNYRPTKPVCEPPGVQNLISFTDDVINETVILRCSVEDIGKPKSKLSFHNHNLSAKEFNLIHSDNNPISIAFVPSVHMNQTEISCVVLQDIPTTTNFSNSFEESCSFPIITFVDKLEVTVSPEIYYMGPTDNVTFICLSNVGNLSNVTWTIDSEIPAGIQHIIKHNQLTFYSLNVSDTVNIFIRIECSVLFKERSSKADARLYIVHEVDNDHGFHLIFLLIIIVFPSSVLVIFLFASLVYLFVRKRRNQQLDVDNTKEPVVAINFTINESEAVALPDRRDKNQTLSSEGSATIFVNGHKQNNQSDTILHKAMPNENATLHKEIYERDNPEISGHFSSAHGVKSKRTTKYVSLPSTSQKKTNLDKELWHPPGVSRVVPKANKKSVNSSERKDKLLSLTSNFDMYNERNSELRMTSICPVDKNEQCARPPSTTVIFANDEMEIFHQGNDVYQDIKDEVQTDGNPTQISTSFQKTDKCANDEIEGFDLADNVYQDIKDEVQRDAGPSKVSTTFNQIDECSVDSDAVHDEVYQVINDEIDLQDDDNGEESLYDTIGNEGKVVPTCSEI